MCSSDLTVTPGARARPGGGAFRCRAIAGRGRAVVPLVLPLSLPCMPWHRTSKGTLSQSLRPWIRASSWRNWAAVMPAKGSVPVSWAGGSACRPTMPMISASVRAAAARAAAGAEASEQIVRKVVRTTSASLSKPGGITASTSLRPSAGRRPLRRPGLAWPGAVIHPAPGAPGAPRQTSLPDRCPGPQTHGTTPDKLGTSGARRNGACAIGPSWPARAVCGLPCPSVAGPGVLSA